MLARLATILFALTAAQMAAAQDWSGASAAIRRDLIGSGTSLGTYFFPDTPDPATATRGLALTYIHIEGSAGNASLAAGLFIRDDAGWRLHRIVERIIGGSPTNPRVGPEGFYLTTMTLGPSDPRCCPTVVTNWFADWTTGQAVQR